MGSPPRVRGKERLAHMAAQSGGIIPACAGKSHALRRLRPASWDHPRICGEKSTLLDKMSHGWGSTPRVQGKELVRVGRVCDVGITPTYAGKSDIPHPAAHYGRQVVRRLCGHFKRA